jgi:uncharacterized circularly permuted ATP-grasp superfamily protein/uncharacterized alpha-E superfamily protein
MSSTPNTPGATAPWRFLEDYHPIDGVFDEMVAAPGLPRPHCEPFVRAIEGLGPHEFASRRDHARRAIHESGVTYNAYGDPAGVDRPWELDLVPLVIAPDDWTRLETGLIQRTRLLNAILRDLYGRQHLLQRGLLPASLVLASPSFLRPCHGLRVPQDLYLHMHGVDLARSPDGEWCVLADRTQTPSGAGYALENRLVLLHSLPEVFRASHIQRLASFFRAHRDTLSALATNHDRPPKVVLLTPGPSSETYFEHAYLARYLGLTLVEGGDLTVRDRRVFIKTLEGLLQVDVILRRLEDKFCDPLELRSDSFLGVAGLVEAVRAGQVVVANALGSGVVKTAALMPFLPGLCKELLGEELLLPSVPTWWCGDPAQRRQVLDRLDHLVAIPAFPSKSQDPLFGRKLSARERELLGERIRSQPEDYVAQSQISLSTAPAWHRHRFEPWPIVFRTYVAAAGDSFVAMPGGLTRVSSAQDSPIVSMQFGAKSKDTWVLSNGPVGTASLLVSSEPVRVQPTPTGLPSRVAENLFWLGRYVERAEHTARLLRSFVSRLADQDTTEDAKQLSALLHLLIDVQVLPEEFGGNVWLRKLEEDMLDLIAQQSPHAGLRSVLNDVRRIATAVRDRLSVDTWRILSLLQQDVRLRHGRIQFEEVLAHLNRIITDLAAFSGMEMENMTRGHGWRFLSLGRRLERSINLVSVLRTSLAVARGSDGAIVEPLLEIADSSMTYRRRYFAQPRLIPALNLLLADETNARALAFQLAAASEHILHLPRDPAAPSPTREEQLIGDARARLLEAETITIGPSADDQLRALDERLRAIEDDLKALSDAITFYYFSHAELRVS